jgi:penicillin-binding protein 1C
VRSVTAVVLFAAAGAGTIALGIGALGPPRMAEASRLSVVVEDRQGRLLRAFTTEDGRWRLPVNAADVDQRYLAMLQAYEDRRFHTHPGVDVAAVVRAAAQLLHHGRPVSGASTLTMQVARLVDGEHDRRLVTKLRQMLRALQLEQSMSKDEILALYLRLAPFGGNLEGVRAASFAYFGKEPRRLSIGEAGLLVALPQSPEARRPDRNPDLARKARDRVLERAAEAGVITAAEARAARSERVPTARLEFPKLAPHLAEAEAARQPDIAAHRTTIDRDIQASLEEAARAHAHTLGPRISAAIVAVENRTGNVLAHVGSADYFDADRLGAIDMTGAIRSPGSTLKPLIYGLAFEGGLAHPETLIEDRPARFGTYAPKNFDEEFHGTVTIRDALARSLNIPAVKTLNAVGPGRLAARLRRLGIVPVLPGMGEPTLAMALGGVGLRLVDLASLYASLANGGSMRQLTEVAVAGPGVGTARTTPSQTLLAPVAAWYVTDILKDAPPPASAVGGRIAYKTGTSYGYRDAWAIGYDGRHTVGVWVGRADGSSTPGMTGRGSAAPLLFDAFQRISQTRTAFAPAPVGVLRTSGAALPPPLKRFSDPGDSQLAGPYLDPPVAIAFPPDRAEVEVDGDGLPVVLKAEGGALPLTWMVDGAPIEAPGNSREVAWQPNATGFVRLSVIDAKGRVDRVTVRLR